MARKSTVVYLYIKNKIRLFELGVSFLECGQYWRFLHFERLWRRRRPPGNSKIRKKIYLSLSVKRNAFLQLLRWRL